MYHPDTAEGPNPYESQPARLIFEQIIRVFQLRAPGRWELRDVVEVCGRPEILERVLEIDRIVNEIASEFWRTYRPDESPVRAKAAERAALAFLRKNRERWEGQGFNERQLAKAIAQGPSATEVDTE